MMHKPELNEMDITNTKEVRISAYVKSIFSWIDASHAEDWMISCI